MNVIVLAGGRSRRMGRDKARLPFLGMPLAVRVLERLRPCARRLLVVANDDAGYVPPDVLLVRDVFPGRGPLAGLHAGLLASDADLNLVVGCDLPFASAAAGLLLAGSIGDADAAVPVVGGRPQPLHALYRRRCLCAAEELLARGRPALMGLLERVRVRWVEERALARVCDPRLLTRNVNTPRELRTALALAASARPGNTLPLI